MKNIIFIAPAGAGKGTQSDLLVAKYGYVHISTGDLFRAEISSGSELGKKVEAIVNSGALVSDDIMTAMLKNRLSQSDVKNGFIIDGYPRTVEQAKILSAITTELGITDFVTLYLDMDYETAKNRALGRITCPKCKKGYNKYVEFLKPLVDNLCDDCHVELVARDDDNEESFKIRYNTYLDNTKDIVSYYDNLGILRKIDNSGTPEETFARIESVID